MKSQLDIGKLAMIGVLIGSLFTLAAAQPIDPYEDNLSEDVNEFENESVGFIEGIMNWFRNLGEDTLNQTEEGVERGLEEGENLGERAINESEQLIE